MAEHQARSVLTFCFVSDKSVLSDAIDAAKLLKEEKKITSRNLALVLVHDVLLANGGIQAGDGPIKQAILRHKTRLNSEFQRIKIKLGVKSTKDLARATDERAGASFYPCLATFHGVLRFTGKIPRYVRVNTTRWTTEEAIQAFISRGYVLSGPFEHT